MLELVATIISTPKGSSKCFLPYDYRSSDLPRGLLQTYIRENQTVIQNQLKWEDYVKSKVMEFEMRNADHDSHNTLLPSERMMKTVDSLQIEYSSRIKINTDMFEEIELTQIDMFTILTNDAYPIIEPGFPILTKNHRLDYGSQIKLP